MFLTPASLLFRLKNTDEEAAWNRFVELYTPLLFHWGQQQGLQDSDCADLVQDVFLILWRKLPDFQYDPQKSFHAWLKTIFLNRHRSRQRQGGSLPVSAEPSEDLAQANVPADGHQQLVDEDESRYLIRQAFRLIEGEFSANHQQIFRLYVLEERHPEEIARQLGISPGTVYGVKSKILSRLRQELKILIN